MFGGESLSKAIAISIALSILLSVQITRADYLNRSSPAITEGDSFNLLMLDPWSDATKAKFYDSSPTTALQSVLDFINTETPASVLFEGKSRLQNPWPSGTSRKIARYCMYKTGSTTGVMTKGVLPLLSCVSSAVFATAMDFYNKGLAQSGCVVHALGIVDVVKTLGLRNIWANFYANSFGDGTFHVTNRIMLRGTDGRIYTYVHDNSSDPSAIFPLSYAAIQQHDRNNDGRTDNLEMPEILLPLD